MSLVAALAGVLFQLQPPQAPMRDPAWSRDGRLAVSIDGDLWVQRRPGRDAGWRRLTDGAAWDRAPAWTADARALVFASDRDGRRALWRVPVTGGPPERLTSGTEDDHDPSVAPDGAIVFTRGTGDAARLWVREASGAERRLTSGTLPEGVARVSPDGRRVAYLQWAESGGRLRVRARAEPVTDTVVVADRDPSALAWAPDGERIAFASRAPRPGTWVSARDGRYVNLATPVAGTPAWSPDGRTLAIAESEGEEPGYNGDPQRLPDRVAEALGSVARLRWVAAPPPPDVAPAALAPPAPLDRRARNAEHFDRIWSRLDALYFAAPAAAARRAAWRRLRERHRPLALAAASDRALEERLHALLRERPDYGAEAQGRAVVASAHPVATAAGLEVLRRGGNVVDAAVAVSFALGVAEPDASGPGGYGEMLVFLKGMREPALIEFMARVPEEGGLDNATLQQGGRYPADGPVLAMVPGTVAGMHAAWSAYGGRTLPWGTLLAPAIRAAREGVPVSDGLATTLRREAARFRRYEGSRALFFRDGRPLAAGDTLRNPDLAWTLERIAAGGADAFYKGEVAQRLVRDLRGRGSAMRATDLARYFAPERPPVRITYRGNTLYSSAPPVAGGATLAAQLNALERLPALAPYTEDADALHAMVAAWQLVPPARGRIADPGLWPVTLAPFTSKDSAAARWRCFDPARALDLRRVRGDTLDCGPLPSPAAPPREGMPGPRDECAGLDHADGSDCRPQGTTAFVVGDAEGNMVAVTQTLGTWGGNFYVTPGLGFLYNDKLTSYGTDPTAYGARLPFARHGSTLAPTLAFRGEGDAQRPWFAIGAAGNAWITSAVYQGVIGMADLGVGPQRALELPRFLPGTRATPSGRETVLDLEDGVAPGVVDALRAMGYRVEFVSLKGELRMGYGAALLLDGGGVRAGADPRRAGTAGAVPDAP